MLPIPNRTHNLLQSVAAGASQERLIGQLHHVVVEDAGHPYRYPEEERFF